ncbi:hypothetical protein A5699_04100 [Mycobacterium sp. E802]|uniref:UPF0158 family protein n=1 Tax=Mycobacterium sp. E802 TaxID=1834152 RepID=UPI0007FEA0DD|nr:UPF0158 family protein [Mycobacterium sp. E802]OBG83450.1 hypothetical protein A5699_04100 [Mycobacterium sp. E802]
MARTWLSVTVELLGGRGGDLWPWPGRVFAVGPSHTFADLADAINDAFARWDRAHLSLFTLADGRVVTDAETGAEIVGSFSGPIAEAVDIEVAKVARIVGAGAEFQFTFDLGDDWVHRCVVGAEKVDPLHVLGVTPRKPLPYWGWGNIPDQYGRRWADDDGRGGVPSRPAQRHPMLLHTWPAPVDVAPIDLTELRAAIATDDADRFLAAVRGKDVDDVLQQVGAGLPMALKQRRDQAEPVTVSIITRLTQRAGAGDEVLIEDLLACLRDEPLAGRAVPVDLESLGLELEGDQGMSGGGYLDLQTGEVIDEESTDPMMVGEDAAVDVDDDPDRWLRLDRVGSRDGWLDMADFAARQRDRALRERLETAITGKGAFRQFRDLVHREGLVDRWHAFAADRQFGRAREFLAEEGIRVGAAPGQRSSESSQS